MKPLISPLKAWTCIVISLFGIAILSTLAHLFRSNSHWVLGSESDPDPARRHEIASTLMSAVLVYFLFFLFCGCQAVVDLRARRENVIRVE